MKIYCSHYDNWPIICNIITSLYKVFICIIIILIINHIKLNKQKEYTYFILNNYRINYTNYLKNRGLFKSHKYEKFNEFKFTNAYGTNTLIKENYIAIYSNQGFIFLGESETDNIKNKYLFFYR